MLFTSMKFSTLRKTQMLINLLDWTSRAAMYLAAFIAFGLAFVIVIDISTRTVGIMFYGVAEHVRNWLVVIIFLQIPYAVRIRSMLKVDMLTNHLPNWLRRNVEIASLTIGFLFFSAVVYGGWDLAIDSFVNNEFEGEGVGSTRVPAWPARFAVVYGCGVSAIYYLLQIVEMVTKKDTFQLNRSRQYSEIEQI